MSATPRWYRIGAGTLGVPATDTALAERFETIYGACAVADHGAGPTIACDVHVGDDAVTVRFDDPEALDQGRFIETVLPDRGYRVLSRDGARTTLALPEGGTCTLVGDHGIEAPSGSAWRPLVANLAVSRLLRLQRDHVFLHAAAIRLGDRGLLACGPKRSGKTTLALGLGARGHAVLGDELIALRLSDAVLVPVPRTIAARAGPVGAAGGARLAEAPGTDERFPDGEVRRRVALEDVAPVARPTPLTTLAFLRSIGPVTRLRERAMAPDLLVALTPLAASQWERPPAAFAFSLLRACASARVVEVDAGPPDELLAAIERLMET